MSVVSEEELPENNGCCCRKIVCIGKCVRYITSFRSSLHLWRYQLRQDVHNDRHFRRTWVSGKVPWHAVQFHRPSAGLEICKFFRLIFSTELFGRLHLNLFLQVFVPDCMNQFSVQSEADALLEKQEKDILPPLSTPKTPSKCVKSVFSLQIYICSNIRQAQ